MSSSAESATSALPDPIVHPAELDHFVASIRPHQLSDIGTERWLQSHQTVLKLLQQATIEMRSHQEEAVVQQLIDNGRLPVLVHELFVVQLWRQRVLPQLLAIEAQPAASFALYTVLFHEVTALQLCECVLFHPDGGAALNETVLDLIDYLAQAVAQLPALAAKAESEAEIADRTDGTDDLQRQQTDIVFRLGMRSISALCYIVDRLDRLGLSAVARLIRTHDVPCLLSQVLHAAPWRRRRVCRRTGAPVAEKFHDDGWSEARGDAQLRLTKVEAQTWLCMRQLLLNAEVQRSYAITEFRQRELAKCQGLMHDVLLDQLPPLAEFKHYLVTLQVSQAGVGGASADKSRLFGAVLMEEVPMVRERIVGRVKKEGGWRRVVEEQEKIFLHKSVEEVREMAQRLNETYGAEAWEQMEGERKGEEEEEMRECGACGKMSAKKCFQCKRAWYCSRECQVKDWPQHKAICRTE